MNDFLECAQPKRRYRKAPLKTAPSGTALRAEYLQAMIDLHREAQLRRLLIALINSLGGCLSAQSTDAEIASEASFVANRKEIQP